MQNPFDQFDAPQAPGMGAPAVIQGPPKLPDPYQVQRDQISDQRWQQTQDRQDRTEARVNEMASRLPEGKEKALKEAASIASSLERARTRFNPDYLGLGSSVENFAQGFSPVPVGTPGQRDWWADFRRTDNIERNELFGASLSGATTITPDMTPEEARKNIERRSEIMRGALKRYRDFLISEGYNARSIDILIGNAAGDAPAQPQQDNRQPMGVAGAAANAVEGLAGGSPGTPPDYLDPEQQRLWTMLTPAARQQWESGEINVPGLPLNTGAPTVGDAERDAQRNTLGGEIDAFGRGLADTATFGFADEIAAGAQTLFGGGTYAGNLDEQRGTDDADGRVNSYPRFAGQITGGAMLPIGLGATSPAQLARVGAGAGAAYGVGSGENGWDRVQQGVKGGLAGAAGGYAFGTAAPMVGNALARFATPNATRAERSSLMQAAERQGIQPMPADVGGPLTRRATAVGAQLPFSAGSIVRGGERVIDQSRAARDRIAAGVGEARGLEGGGDAALQGADKFRTLTSQRANRLYKRAEELSQNVRIVPKRTIEALDANIAELSAVPGMEGSAELNALTKLREQVSSGNFSVAGVRGMRSALRQKHLNEGLRGSDFERRVKQVVDAAGEDVSENLSEQGLEGAAQAFAAADGFWRTRVETIDKVLAPIIGKDGSKSGERIVLALEDAAKTNGRRLQQFMAALPNEERSVVQATLISRLGNSKPGSQNAEGTAFSLDGFLTSWSAMTPRAKASLFPQEARAALDDLAKVAAGSKAAGQYANRSNTGSIVGGLATGAGAAQALYAPWTTALALVGQYGAGKLLASPAFARFLARPPRDMRAASAKLGAMASKNPAISAEIQAFMRAANDNGGRALERSVAASETDEQNRR
jgi:hypothetical protein